jgi:hypothetical protein
MATMDISSLFSCIILSKYSIASGTIMLWLRAGGGGENRVRATIRGATGRWITLFILSDCREQQQESLFSARDNALIFSTQKR